MNNRLYGNLIFELSKEGRKGYSLPRNNFGEKYEVPASLRRAEDAALPECDELTVVRHYTNLSNNNFGVDTGFYPLGSCTMKYNPKINEEMAALPQFQNLHPLQPNRLSLVPVLWLSCSRSRSVPLQVWLTSHSSHTLVLMASLQD